MNIIITGSSRGKGLELAKEFVKEGHSVLIHGRDREFLALKFAEIKRDYPDSLLHLYACDTTNYNSVERMLWESNRFFGSVDIWINNGGSNSKTKLIGIKNSFKAFSMDNKYDQTFIYSNYRRKDILLEANRDNIGLIYLKSFKSSPNKLVKRIVENKSKKIIIKNRGWFSRLFKG